MILDSDWKEVELGSLLNFRRGHDLPKTSMVEGIVPVVGSNGIIGFHDEYTTLAPCLTVGRSGNIGKPSYIDENCWAHNTTLYVDDFKGNNPLYLYYLLQTLKLSFYGGGSAVPTLNRNHIHPIKVKAIMQYCEQEKIANFLKTFDDKIDVNKKINNNLEQQAQVLFKSWFVDFEPFDEQMVDSPIGYKVPESLKMIQIADLPHVLETGKRPKGGAVSDGIPSIGAENVKSLGKVDFSTAKYIPVEFAASMKKGDVRGYELMIYKDGGKPGEFIPHFSMFGEGFPYDHFFINEHVFKLDFGNRGFNEFCYFYLQTDYAYNWLANNGGKAAVPGINQQDVNAIWIFHPDHPQVEKYCEWVQPIFTSILKNCLQNVKLANLRDTLLPKLLSGELDISGINI